MSLETIPDLPLEIWILIAGYLSLTELFNASLVCRNSYNGIMRNDSLARYSLQRCAPSSVELHNAHAQPDRPKDRFARALRRLMRRHMAMASARPFSESPIAKIVGEFIYRNGMLCYVEPSQQSLQMQNLHSPYAAVGQLVSMNVRSALAQFPVDDVSRLPKSTFRPLHYSHGLASWLCQFSGYDHSWVIVVNVPEHRVIATWNVGSSIEGEYHVRNNASFVSCITRQEPVGRQVWHVQTFDIERLSVVHGRSVLTEFAGTSINQSICFEIFDDHFYALSASVFHEGEAQQYNSSYYASRCRLGSVEMEQTPRAPLWRRQHKDGPLYEPLCELSLSRDDETKILRIHEVRAEWLNAEGSPAAHLTRTCYRTELPSSRSSTETASSVATQQRRRPSHVHDGGVIKTTDNRDIPIRSYQPCVATFVDVRPIHREEESSGHQAAVAVQIRAITRSLAASGTTKYFVHMDSPQESRKNLVSYHNLKPMAGCSHGFPIDAKYEGVVDERSLVLAVSEPGSLKTLVFVSFDPALAVPEM